MPDVKPIAPDDAFSHCPANTVEGHSSVADRLLIGMPIDVVINMLINLSFDLSIAVSRRKQLAYTS
jgi:hypothetical protein